MPPQNLPPGATLLAPPTNLAATPNLPAAIGIAEGAKPGDHNPGNLSLDTANKLGVPVVGSRRSTGVGATDIAQFPDDATGQRALQMHLSKYSPDTTYRQLANQYAPGQPNWLNNVTKAVGASPDDPIGGAIKLPPGATLLPRGATPLGPTTGIAPTTAPPNIPTIRPIDKLNPAEYLDNLYGRLRDAISPQRFDKKGRALPNIGEMPIGPGALTAIPLGALQLASGTSRLMTGQNLTNTNFETPPRGPADEGTITYQSQPNVDVLRGASDVTSGAFKLTGPLGVYSTTASAAMPLYGAGGAAVQTGLTKAGMNPQGAETVANLGMLALGMGIHGPGAAEATDPVRDFAVNIAHSATDEAVKAYPNFQNMTPEAQHSVLTEMEDKVWARISNANRVNKVEFAKKMGLDPAALYNWVETKGGKETPATNASGTPIGSAAPVVDQTGLVSTRRVENPVEEHVNTPAVSQPPVPPTPQQAAAAAPPMMDQHGQALPTTVQEGHVVGTVQEQEVISGARSANPVSVISYKVQVGPGAGGGALFNTQDVFSPENRTYSFKTREEAEAFRASLSKTPMPEGVKLTTDSLGVRWAENPDGIRVSIPNRITPEQMPDYVSGKLAEQAAAQATIKEKVASAQPQPAMPKSAPLRDTLARLEDSGAQLQRSDLTDAQRAAWTTAHSNGLTEAARTVATSKDPDKALTTFASKSADLGKKLDYLDRHLQQRDHIAAVEQAQLDITRQGQDVARNQEVIGRPYHPERDAYGNMLVDEKGKPVYVEGAARATRDALGQLLGKRQVEIADKYATPSGPVPEHIQAAIDQRDELKEAISSGAIGPENYVDANDQLRTLESIISEHRRTATKLSGKPTIAQVAAVKGVPVSEVQTTGAGKAVDINHNGLPVMTQRIWEDVYGGPKHKGLPTLEQLTAKRSELANQKDILDTVSKRTAEQRAIIRRRAEQGGFAGEKQDDSHLKLLSNVDSKYYHSLLPETKAKYQGWLTPERTHFVPTGGINDLAMNHNAAAIKLLGDAYDPTKGTAEKQLRDLGWIRKSEPGGYEVSQLPARRVNAIDQDALADSWGNRPVTIDYVDKNGKYTSITSSGDWLEKGLLRDLNAQLAQLREPRLTNEEGVGGTRLLSGMALGGTIGAAVGGPIGAGVGSLVGALVSALPVPRALATELTELRDKFGYSLEQARDTYKNWLAPVSADPNISDVMFNRNAEIARSDAHAREAFNAYKLAAFSLPRDLQVKFVDMVKAGDLAGIQRDFGPEWRTYAEDRRIEEDDLWTRMQDAVDDRARALGQPVDQTAVLPYLENHDRVMWKVLPGGKEWEARNVSRQLEGTKGMLKPHTLDDMSTGVKAGGVPYSWNPVENDFLAWHDTERYIQTTKAVTNFIDNGMAQFVKTGESIPDGYSRVKGTQHEVYFPAASGEGLIKAGEWVMHKDAARMIDNVSSPDYIRNNVLGRSWLGWRRTIGTGRLFGPFHAFLMNNTAMGFKAGMGIREAANLGIGNADIGHIMSGLRDLATSPISGISEFRTGQLAREGEFDPKFWQTDAGKSLKKLYPGVENYLDLLWQGGGKNMFRVDEDMRMRYSEGLKQRMVESADKFSKGKYIQSGFEASAAAANAALLPIQLAMKPLFETYIPSLKLGHALNDLDLSLQERAADIANGKTTEAAVARDVVRRVEGYFGEFNADNLFLKNTFRTALTAYYRSFSFRFGTVDRAWAAVRGQATNAAEAAQGKARLQLNPDMAVWGGMLLHAAIASAIVMKLMAHKNPSSLTDVMHPQTGELDDRGKPIRMDWPSYVSGPLSQIKQNYGLGTISYATGGQSDFLQYMKEAINNKKFDGGYVSDPAEHDKLGQFFYRLSHAVVPIAPGKYPFVVENVNRWASSGMPKGKAAAAVALGMSPTRRAEGLTDAESLALDLGSASSHQPAYSDADQKRYAGVREATAAIRNGRPDTGQIVGDLIRNQTIQPSDIDKAVQNASLPYLQYEVQGDQYKRGLDFKDTYAVMKVANPSERKLLTPYFLEQFDKVLDSDPKNAQSNAAKLQEILGMPKSASPTGKVVTSAHANLPLGESMENPDTRYEVAQHEAAHAIVAEHLNPGSVQGMALSPKGGVTNISTPGGITDAAQLNKDQLIDNLAFSYAGGLGEPGGTTEQHGAADRDARHLMIGSLASTDMANAQRMMTGKMWGSDPMLQAPELQAAATARANLVLSDPAMRQAQQNLAGQLTQSGRLSGSTTRRLIRGR